MDIMESILEVLVTDGQNRHWGTVVKVGDAFTGRDDQH